MVQPLSILAFAAGLALSAALPPPCTAATISLLPTAGAAVQPVAYGDGPATGRHHGSGHHAKSAPAVSPTVSSTHGLSAEDADKIYRKKYGF